MNWSDSERIAAVLEKIGYSPASPKTASQGGPASNMENADLIVVNACSVRQPAIDRIWGLTSKFKKIKVKNKNLKILLTGCILKPDFKKFKERFDYILSVKALFLWKKFLKEEQYFYYPEPRKPEFNKEFNAGYLKIIPRYSSRFSASVPISTGCDNFCAFCAVPYVRGPEFSRPAEDIVNEIKSLLSQKYKEIWLLGQNVNSYRYKIKSSSSAALSGAVAGNSSFTKAAADRQKSKIMRFPELLKIVNDIPGNFWIRFTSSHPKDLSDKLIETMAKCKKVTPYLNLPAQSGDNKILETMNRPYTVGHYKCLIKKLRKAFKEYRKTPKNCALAKKQKLEEEIAISTDIIVGFPEETKKQFQNTIKLFKETKFDMAYISQFSSRSGTAAAKMKDTVTKTEKKQRDKSLTKILRQTALSKNKKFIGKEIEVLIEKNIDGFLIGKSRHYKTVKLQASIHGSQALIGQFVEVRIIKAMPWGLKGKVKK